MSDNNYAPAIYIAESPEAVGSYKWYPEYKFLHPNLEVLTVESAREKYPKMIPNDAISGSILLIHPDKTKYILSQNAEEVYVKHFVGNLSLIVQNLGAKNFSYSRSDVETKETKFNLNTGLDFEPVKAEVKIDKTDNSKLEKLFEQKDEFQPKPKTTESWKRACKIAEDNNLMGNEDIKGLINAADPNNGGGLVRREITTVVTSEFESNLKVAASVKAFSSFKIDVDVANSIKYIKTVSVTWKVDF